MSTAATRASELHKLYNKAPKPAPNNTSWEQVFLTSARNVSTPLAARLLAQMELGKNTATPVRVFENACGVGVVAPLLQQVLKPEVLGQSKIVCGDFSEQNIGVAKKRVESEGWVNTGVETADAQKLRFADGAFTHVATNIGFHVVPDSEAALDEAIRVLEPGGVLGFTTWNKVPGWVDEVQDAFKSFPFEAPCVMVLQTTAWGNWADVNWSRKALVDKGLEDVKVDLFAYLSHVESPAGFVENFSIMIDWMMTRGWSEELRKEHPREEVHGLVSEFLEKKYGGGGWDMSWVGLIASGRVPSDR